MTYIFNEHTVFGIKHLCDPSTTADHSVGAYCPRRVICYCVRMFQEILQWCIDVIGIDKGPAEPVLSGGRGMGCGGSNLE